MENKLKINLLTKINFYLTFDVYMQLELQFSPCIWKKNKNLTLNYALTLLRAGGIVNYPP